DPFAEGHEDQTPPELYAVRPNGGAPDTPGWTVRVVPNLYPALDPDAPAPEPHADPHLFTAQPPHGARGGIINAPAPAAPAPDPHADPDLFTAQPAHGEHEVIINAPDPVTSLADLSVEQVGHA